MKKKFITNLALLLFLNLLIKPFWIFGIDRTVQNIVGAGDYGFYISLFNFSLVLNVFLDLGITNYNNRSISQYHQMLTKYLSNIVVIKFMLAVVYLVVSFTVAIIIGYSWAQMYLLLFLVFNQFLISFTLYLRSNISGLQMFRTDSLLSVLDKSLMVAICSVLLWGNIAGTPFKIEWFVYAQTITYVISTLIIFGIVLSKSEKFRLNFDLNYFRIILRQSLPFALLVLLMSLYNWGGLVILERILPNGQEEAGIYAQGNRLLEAVSMFGFMFAGLLLPMFSRMIKQKEGITQLLRFSTLLLIVPSIVLAIISLCYRDEIMGLLYHEVHQHTSLIFSLLMFSFIGIGNTYIFGSLLTANGSLRKLNIMAAIGVVLNITLNLILIPMYHALGMAIATLCTQIYTATAQILIVKYEFKLRTDFSLIIKLILFSAAVLFFAELSKNLPFNWIINLGLVGMVALFLAFISKLISLKGLFSILKNE